MTMLSSSLSELVAATEAQVTLPADTLASRFAATAAIHPERTAITFGAKSLSYAELDAASRRVASALSALNIPADALVAIYLDRSIEMIVAMLGAIKAGAAYLPLDQNYPVARIRETIEDAKPIAVLAEFDRLGQLEGSCENLFDIHQLLSTKEIETPAVNTQPSDLAYVIYTSGSTGKPKGVMVTHENVIRLLDRTAHWYRFDYKDVWTMFHSFAFDFSVWEIWGCLLYGGRLVIVPYALSRSPEEFYELLATEGVTVLNQTPTAFSLLMQAESRIKPRPLALRYVIFGGEALNIRALQPWFEAHGEETPQLINMYGITETTVHVTYRRIVSADAQREQESLIGEPIPDLRIVLLDEALQPVAAGETGEICIGGPGVARGYLNRPELTAQRFVSDPLSLVSGHLYRSGDLAYRRQDGELVYLGRADRQVKINGFRIELGEIESVLTSLAGIAQVCVIPHADGQIQRLAAYYVSTHETVELNTLRSWAEAHLPAHMRPAFYVPMAALPINNNGKVDRDALPAPETSRQSISANTDVGNGNAPEQKLAAIWRRVLKLETIGLDDNFFDAGGTSLLFIQLRNEIQTEFDRSIPVTWLFEHTTVRSFAAKLSEPSQPAPEATTGLKNRAQQQRNSFARMKTIRGVAS